MQRKLISSGAFILAQHNFGFYHNIDMTAAACSLFGFVSATIIHIKFKDRGKKYEQPSHNLENGMLVKQSSTNIGPKFNEMK